MNNKCLVCLFTLRFQIITTRFEWRLGTISVDLTTAGQSWHEHIQTVITLVFDCLSGQYFVVEEDIREFTQMKVDKRFQGILNMLRHCQRLRELRGGGFIRYMLL